MKEYEIKVGIGTYWINITLTAGSEYSARQAALAVFLKEVEQNVKIIAIEECES